MGTSIFGNIVKQLEKNDKIEPTIELVKALDQVPNIGGVLVNYAGLPHNKRDGGPLLSAIDPENYEHLMLMGKIIKFAEKSLDADDEFL